MRLRAVFVIGVVAASIVPGVAVTAPCAAAAETGLHRAGVIIEFPDATVKRFCVAFAEESITGYELLRRTGLPLGVQDGGGGNIAVCSIDSKGCAFPQKPCFCECATTGDCTFWGYYSISNGAWRFQSLGAGAHAVRDGDVEGWRYGRHSTSGSSPPPNETLDAICARGVSVQAAGRTDASQRPPARWLGYAFAGVFIAALATGVAWFARDRRREDEQ